MAWSIDGKTVLITGSTSGIGLEAAVALARLGARPLVVGRRLDRIRSAVALIQSRAGVTPESYCCDFSSQADIRRFAAELLRTQPRLDVLVNNAGGVHKRRTTTVDGIEATFATNHLGYFLLTTLLQDLLIRSAPARIVNVASAGHRRVKTFDPRDLASPTGGYWILNTYAKSKLANVLFSSELARRLAGTGVTSNALHPGRVGTNIWSGAPLWTKPLIALLLKRSFITVEEGAQTIVQLVASQEMEGVTGEYFEERVAVAPAPLAQDAALASRLWQMSESLVRLPLQIPDYCCDRRDVERGISLSQSRAIARLPCH